MRDCNWLVTGRSEALRAGVFRGNEWPLLLPSCTQSIRRYQMSTGRFCATNKIYIHCTTIIEIFTLYTRQTLECSSTVLVPRAQCSTGVLYLPEEFLGALCARWFCFDGISLKMERTRYNHSYLWGGWNGGDVRTTLIVRRNGSKLTTTGVTWTKKDVLSFLAFSEWPELKSDVGLPPLVSDSKEKKKETAPLDRSIQ